MTRIGPATLGELYQRVPAIRRVYAAAFALPPWAEDPTGPGADRFVWRLARDSTRDGFTTVLARHAKTDTTIGFAYGCTVHTGQHAALVQLQNVEAALGGHSIENSFTLIDMAVDPTMHGQGIGGRLHDTLFDAVGQRRCWLLTHQAADFAVGLYLKRGWTHACSVPRIRGAGQLEVYTRGWS